VPIYGSAAELFTAVRALARFGARPTSVVHEAPAAAAPLPAAGSSRVLDQRATAALLASYGIDAPGEGVASTAEEAVRLAVGFGYPVVLKVVSDRIAHKTEIGGVLTGISDDDAVRAAFELLRTRGRAALDGDEPDGVLVQQQVDDGVEMIAGVIVDAQFGPFVLVGSGGVFTELLDDVVLRPVPVTAAEAVEMIAELRGKALLDGYRGAPAADVDALATTVSAVSRLAAEHASELAELDLNPILVRPRGKGALVPDALVVLAAQDGA
jgi:acyl-CoA synthetase (NDP forming)